jgi:hypothetical protein|tara:strand:- start:797 stop:1024 length:228 start_codon:yes stop_codon:yes gene_type:complete
MTEPVEKVSQEEMQSQFQQRYTALLDENKKLSAKIKENEITALKLQGALETLDYFIEKPEEPEDTDVTDELVTGE